VGHLSPLEWLALAEYELLLFAGAFFLVGALDELAVDIGWAWLKLTGRANVGQLSRKEIASRQLSGPAAVFIPAWQEGDVIEITVAHALSVWPQKDLTIYVGCYLNDPGTVEAAMRGSGGDPRVRIVVHGQHGPTTKADCLNRLYAALEDDEARRGREFHSVVLHDAEDMVDPAALSLLDETLQHADFVQIPVLPEAQRQSRWIGSHYCEEFAESQKSMVVREALSASLPAAGVGCGFSRKALGILAAANETKTPFEVDSLTEDYELGMRIRSLGGQSRFLRMRGEDGTLIATRACFPARIDHAVRQKARWMHGIAFQGWDRLGWTGGAGEYWMRLRDRRGPLTALVLFAGYLLLVIGGTMFAAEALGYLRPWNASPLLKALVAANLAAVVWRAAMRFTFTAREYGWSEGLWAVARIPVANVIAIMAARRALAAYIATLLGGKPTWDKTSHHAHPATIGVRATT